MSIKKKKISKKVEKGSSLGSGITSLTNEENKSLQYLFRKINSGEIALFLGAGVSLGSKAPSGKDLIEIIKSYFSDLDFEDIGSNLLDICQEIDENGKRNQLNRFVHKQFYGLDPTEAILSLPQYPWPVLFTTNYDNLIEKSFEKNFFDNNRTGQVCRPVVNGDALYNLSRRDGIYLFKLMGDINRDEIESSPILTRSEYNNRSNSRRKMLEVLSTFVRDGAVLYIGYSFKDRIIVELIDELRKIHNDRMDDSFALIPNLERGSKIERTLIKRHIRPIPLTFEGFINELGKCTVKTTPIDQSIANITLNLNYYNVKIPYRDLKEFEEYFKILSEEELNKKTTDDDLTEEQRIDKFLKGQSESWDAFKNNWDFKRDIYSEIKKKVDQEVTKNRPEDNDAVLLLGGGGLGKSIMLKRLAYDLYESGNPVIMINSYLNFFDYRLIEKFCSDVNSKSNSMDRVHKVTIIFDNIDVNIDHVKKILIYLKNHSRPALIVGAARPNEWEYSKQKWGFGQIISSNNIFTIPQKMGELETDQLIKHLGILLNNDEFKNDPFFWATKAKEDYESDFFAIIYGLVDPARRKLDEILWDEYKKLPSEPTRLAYEYVCLFSQYDMPLPIDMIVNPLRKKFNYSYKEFLRDIYETEAKSLMIELEGDTAGDLFYRSKNRIIAQKIVEKLFDHTIKEQLDNMVKRYTDILLEVKPLDKTQMDIVRSLLVTYLGPNGIDHQKINADLLTELYDTVINKGINDSTILLHYGLMESNRDNFEKAKELLNRSLRSSKKYQGSSLGRESERNIYHALGVLYSREALNNLPINQDTALMQFDKANFYFKNSRIRSIANSYPYHSQAYYSYRRGMYYDKIGQTEEALKYYSEALEVIDNAKASVPDYELDNIIELESRIYIEKFGDFNTAKEKILSFIEKSPNLVNGYVIISKLLYKEAKKFSIGKQRYDELINQAKFYVDEGLKLSRKNSILLRVKYNILIETEPDNKEKIYELILKRYEAFEGKCIDLNLLFDLGVLSFERGNYIESKKFFQELEEISIDHPYRSGIKKVARDQNNSNKIFKGIVSTIISRKEGKLLCDDIGYPITFNPLAQKRIIDLNQHVEFNISFNYRGFMAIELRPI